MSYLLHLDCPECARVHSADELQTVCSHCGSPLLARYDLSQAVAHIDRDALAARSNDLWRWRELLPVQDASCIVTLGEGGTPMLAAPHFAHQLGLSQLYVKDEGRNPTSTFKARGIAMGVPGRTATVAALYKLITSGWVKPDECVVCLNTGTGLKDAL